MRLFRRASALSKKEIFESAPVPRAITAMAVPTIISQLINLIYNLADTVFIGQTGDVYKTAGVTVCFTIFMMTTAFSNLSGIGGGSLIARLIGENRSDEAKRVSAFSFYCAIAIGVAYSLLLMLLLNPILRLFGASSDTMPFAKQYVWTVVILGNVPTLISLTCAHLLRNSGYSKQASIGLSGGGILNILLDPLFMFVLMPEGMEVLGAGLATLLSNISSASYMIIMLLRASKNGPLSLRLRDARAVSRSSLRGLFSVGIPSAILTGLFDLANIFLNSLIAAYGDLELAAIGIVMKAERLPNAINLGLCQGMMPIVAYNYTSGDHARMRQTLRTVRRYGLLVSAVCVALFELCAAPIVRVFLNGSQGDAQMVAATLRLAKIFLRIRILACALQFLNYHTSYCLQAVGDGQRTLLHAVVRELVFYIPFMYLFNGLFGRYGLVSAVVAGEFCGAMFAMFLLTRWKKTCSPAAR